MKASLALFFLLAAALPAAEPRVIPDEFLYGASTYPELQTREEWNRMLDQFQKAHFKVVRVSESSWGNLETGPGKYNFGWLKDYLDDVQRHGMKAILGTSSYIAPQWLSAKHPEMLVQLRSGEKIHPMARKAACINQPLYRQTLREYILALGRAFKDHPAVIGWQLDNEVETNLGAPCYCSVCQRKWHDWLKQTYHSPAEFNKRLKLVSWGMEVDSLEDVLQPHATVEGGGVPLPALTLANLHFRRDCILNFFIEQKQALREAGVAKWITTDWNTYWTALADDPLARKSLDVAGLNFYQPSGENPVYFKDLAWQLDMHRSAYGRGAFMTTETRVGVAGETIQWDPFPTHDEFRMWMIQPTAYGAFGLMYWSGNRWHGGHWPHWGGVLDWTGQPEPDFSWLAELGEFFDKNSERLLKNPVDASAAVLTDFDQRAALEVYQHTPASKSVLGEVFDALHRLGIGADSLNFQDAATPGKLSKYALVVVPAATALDGEAVVPALRQYVENGGNLVITPFTAYQSWDGLFRSDGFGANLKSLTGVVTRTGRRMGTAPGRQPSVEWRNQTTPVGIDGYCEFMDVAPEVEVLGKFRSSDEGLNGQPAATRRRLGKGSVIRLAFWPGDDSALQLFRDLNTSGSGLLGSGVPAGVQAVPRTDKSMFIINTSSKPAAIALSRPGVDRISGKKLEGTLDLPGYGVLWVE